MSIELIRPYLHLGLHFLVPATVAAIFFHDRLLQSWTIMCATILVDVDHLFADPVYDPSRCSIGFHPLHRYPPIVAYALATAWPRLRLTAIGLLIHMALDGVDCVWMQIER